MQKLSTGILGIKIIFLHCIIIFLTAYLYCHTDTKGMAKENKAVMEVAKFLEKNAY